MKLPPGLKYIIMAGVAGVVAVLLAHSYITSKIIQPLKPTSTVVVAEAEISPGMALSSRVLQTATWPREITPPSAMSNLAALEGRVAAMPIAKGEPILPSKLAPEGTAAGLGGLLDPDRLAVTVKTDEVSGVAGFINPGDRIDVLMDMQGAGANSDHLSKLILQNLKVLSKGQIWDQTADKKPQVVPTVTLEVTPEQAEVLNLASFQGKIRLALRNQINKQCFDTRGIDTARLCSNATAAAVAAPHVAASTPAPKNKIRAVQVIKGMQVSQAEF
ncbi:MAG: Flp pilus assembly protein CpaB [Deltaproteobacteria bacterium]|nr:Flp pilus assembly protein CpaB [Deltaproteobacteria bacterium]